METNKDIVFNYFSGNIKFTRPLGNMTLAGFINMHKNPKPEILDIIVDVKVAAANGDIALKRELKHKLYSFVPAVKFKVGGVRKYEDVENFTGLMQLDFDGIVNQEKAYDLKHYLFTTYQCVVCSYLSPSGKGVKALIHITKPRDKEHYKAIYKTIEAEFEQIGYFDTATKNIVLPLFISDDINILSRDISQTIAWDKEDWTQSSKINRPPPNLKFPTQRYQSEIDYYYDKTVKLFMKRISNISDNGHPQLRTACLILGSRVGAGYITKAEAEQLTQSMIESNSYLNKNIKGYITTSMWAIEEGSKTPKEY